VSANSLKVISDPVFVKEISGYCSALSGGDLMQKSFLLFFIINAPMKCHSSKLPHFTNWGSCLLSSALFPRFIFAKNSNMMHSQKSWLCRLM
jgi:hypothetical protein